MLYTDMTKKAMVLAYKAHHGQVDKGGTPYIFHPVHLAEQLFWCEIRTCVALLHDTKEDCGLTDADLREAGMCEEVIDAVSLLTRPKGMDYGEYIIRIRDSKNRYARDVKVEDLTHNMKENRLPESDHTPERTVEKYKKALKTLTEVYPTSPLL